MRGGRGGEEKEEEEEEQEEEEEEEKKEDEEEEEEEKSPCEKKKGLEVIHFLRAIPIRKREEMKTEFIKITVNLRQRAMKIYLVSSVGTARS